MAFEHLSDNWDEILEFHDTFDPSAKPFVGEETGDSVVSSSREHWLRRKKQQMIRVCALLALSATVPVACIASSDDESSESKDTLPTITTIETTTTPVLTTTTLSFEQDCSLGAILIEQGDTLTAIAGRCGITVQQLALWNNLSDLNSIEAGKYLYVAEPPALTTTTVMESTVPPQTAPPTLPPPPQTSPPAPTTPKPTNDGVLRNPECSAIGGLLHSFVVGETVTSYLVSIGLTSNQAAKLIANTSLLRDYKIANIYEDNPNDNADLRECVPTRDALKLRYGV